MELKKKAQHKIKTLCHQAQQKLEKEVLQPKTYSARQEDETNEPVNELKRIERIVMQELIAAKVVANTTLVTYCGDFMDFDGQNNKKGWTI